MLTNSKICGIDEAGRGALAGPLTIAGCVLTKSINGLNDSKKLTPKKREELFEILQINSYYIILYFSNIKVDTLGLSACLKSGIKIVQQRFFEHEIIMDGNTNFGVNGVKSIIKADSLIPEVSAASILAKVSRDKIMCKYDDIYPEYSFKKHKGYGTSLHVKSIKEHGLSDIHRKSFKLKSINQPSLF